MRTFFFSFLALSIVTPGFARSHAPTTGKGRPLAPVTQEKDDALLVLQLAKELSHEDSLVRSYAAKQLAKMGKDAEDAIPFLVRLLNTSSESNDVRQARRALIAIGEPSLKHLRGLPGYMRTFIKDAINKNKAEGLLKKYPGGFEEADFVNELASMGPDALPFLLQYMDSQARDDDKVGATLVLVRMGDVVLPHLERLYLTDPKQEDYQSFIMDTLWALNSKKAQALFVKGFTHKSKKLRQNSLNELNRRISSPEEAESLSHAEAIADSLPNIIKFSDWGVVGSAMPTAKNFGHLNKALVIEALYFAIHRERYDEFSLRDAIKTLKDEK